MKYFKNTLAVMMVLAASVSLFSQIKPLDAMLTNYQYPFEVYYKDLNSQKQNLKMAYMDVKPKKSERQNNYASPRKKF